MVKRLLEKLEPRIPLLIIICLLIGHTRLIENALGGKELVNISGPMGKTYLTLEGCAVCSTVYVKRQRTELPFGVKEK